MANASSLGPRLLSGEAPKADDISRADTELTSLEEGRRPALDEPHPVSSLRSTGAESTSDQPEVTDVESSRSDSFDRVPDLPALVALTPQLINMLRSVHVANLVKHFTHFCSNVYFQPNGPPMVNARGQLKACQGAGSLPLQSLSKGEKWTVSTIEDKELKKSVLRSWEQYWASHSSPIEIKKMVTRDMQKQVRGVVLGQTDLMRQICFMEEWGGHFPNSSFPSPGNLIRGFARQQDSEGQSFPPGVVTSNFPLALADFNPREQAVDAVSLPSQFQAHAQALFTHIAPNFTLRDVMEDVEQDDTRDLRVRDPQAQAIVVRLLCGTSKFVAEKAVPHAVALLEELLTKLKIESERWTEKDAWEWVESMDVEGEPESQIEEWQRAARAGQTNDEKTRLAQMLWRESWKKVDGAREQGLLKESQAELHELKGEYKEAIASWTAALEADPRSEARIRLKRGNCYRACDQLPEAETDLTTLIELKDPSALQYQVLARPALKRIRQKLKANGNAPAVPESSPTSPEPLGSSKAVAKKSKKKKKGSVDASTAAAIEMVELAPKEGEDEASASSVKESAPPSPVVTTVGAPVSSPPSTAATPVADIMQDSESVEDGPVVSFALASAVTEEPPAAEVLPPPPQSQAPPPAPIAAPAVAATEPATSLPPGLPNGAAIESFSSASSTISSSSSSLPPVPSSSTSLAAETAMNSPATPRSDKRDVSLDRVPSPLTAPQHPVDPMAMAPQGRMLVERQPPPPQQPQQWREPVGYYPPPFPQHHHAPYPMYHPHHPPPPHQHPNGYPLYRQEPPPELSFASLATPGPYYHGGGPPPQHFQGMMPPPQPFYHIPAPPPPPPPQPVFRGDSTGSSYSPRIVPPRPVQIQKPPPLLQATTTTPPVTQEFKVTPPVAVRAPSPAVAATTPAPATPTALVPEAAASPAPPASDKLADVAAVPDAPTPTPAAAAPPAPRKKQSPVPMEFEDGVILFVCADWAATGSCPDGADCPDLHENGAEVDFHDPHEHYASYPPADDSVPASSLVDFSAAAVRTSALSAPEAADQSTAAANASSPAQLEETALPALLVTPAPTPPTAPESVAEASSQSTPASPAVDGADVAAAAASEQPASSSAPPAPLSPAPLRASPPPPAAAPKAAKKAAPADRWWEKGANAPAPTVKEDDWATAGKKAKKPLK